MNKIFLSEIQANLKESELFSQLNTAMIEQLSKIAISKKLTKNEMLFLQKEPAHGFYYILKGSIKIFRLSTDGKEQIISTFRKGDIIGEVPVFEGGCYPANAISLKQGEVLYFNRDLFLRLCKTEPEFLLKLLAILAKRLRVFVEMVDEFSFKDIKSRLASYLLKYSQKINKTKFRLNQTKGSLANKIGTISATFSRTLRKLQDCGAISVNGNIIEVTNFELLTEIAQGTEKQT